MALDLVGLTLRVSIEGPDQDIFSKLPRELGLTTPRLDHISARFYEDPSLTPDQVPVLRDELVSLRDAYREKGRPPAPANADLLGTLDRLIALCEESIGAKKGIHAISD